MGEQGDYSELKQGKETASTYGSETLTERKIEPLQTNGAENLTSVDQHSLTFLPHGAEDDDEKFDVNAVIEATGWGKYQNRVVFVMGIMSFADAAEIWLATVILDNLQCEWGLNSGQKALIPAIVYIFYAFGSFISGRFADKFGRFPVLLLNGYGLVISAIASAFAPSYYVFISCRAVTGFCIGGSYGCSIAYTAEVMPTVKRSWSICILEAYWVVGGVYECLMAYLVMETPNGWRIMVLLTAIPCVIMVILLHFMDESPRYLVINNEEAKAKTVINKICTMNKKEAPTGKIYCTDESSGTYREVWGQPYTRGSVQITIHYFCSMFLSFGIALLAPDMMSLNYCSMSSIFEVTYVNSDVCQVYTKDEYLFLMVMSVSYAPGMVAGTISAEYVGRRWTFIISAYSGALMTCLFLICTDSIFTYTVLFMTSFSYAMYNQVLWIYTPEFYPTYMRATAIGVQNGIGKLGAATGSFLTEFLDDIDIKWTIVSYIIIIFIACVNVTLMNRETKDEALHDERVKLSNNTQLDDNTHLYDNTQLDENTRLYDNSQLDENTRLYTDS